MFAAYIDESEPLGGVEGGPYVMVASIPLTGEAMSADAVRDEVRREHRGKSKFHWNASAPAQRDAMTTTIARLPFIHWAARVIPASGDSPERSRRQCMELLFWELSQLALVSHIIMESRGTADDKRDLKMADMLRSRRVLTGGTRVDHAIGKTEPLLWVPDAVCGAVNARHERDDSRWFGMLNRQLWECP